MRRRTVVWVCLVLIVAGQALMMAHNHLDSVDWHSGPIYHRFHLPCVLCEIRQQAGVAVVTGIFAPPTIALAGREVRRLAPLMAPAARPSQSGRSPPCC